MSCNACLTAVGETQHCPAADRGLPDIQQKPLSKLGYETGESLLDRGKRNPAGRVGAS